MVMCNVICVNFKIRYFITSFKVPLQLNLRQVQDTTTSFSVLYNVTCVIFLDTLHLEGHWDTFWWSSISDVSVRKLLHFIVDAQ